MPDQNAYVVAAYAVTWITLMGYSLYLHNVWRRSRRMLEQAARPSDGEER